jgi:alcohol dehydrogenase class IV
MMEAAHIAGQAINLAQTTAGHAMSYKLSSLYHIAHGHSVSLCVSALLPYTIQNTGRCIDARGTEYLEGILKQIAEAYGCRDVKGLPDVFNDIVFGHLGLSVPAVSDPEDYKTLSSSVNPVRLKNYPVLLDEETIDSLYHQIVREA